MNRRITSSRMRFAASSLARALVESLERRVLFATVGFQIDPNQSQLTAQIALNGSTSTVPQGPSALTAHYQGTLVADVETGSISFPGGSTIAAQTTGNWLPGGGPADYGGETTVLGANAFGAVRDLSFNMVSDTLALATDGTFASGQTLSISAGTISFNVPAFSLLATETLTGSSVVNAVSAASQLTAITTPTGLLETLSIPIDVVYPFGIVGAGDSQLEFTGTIVATASIIATPPVIDLNGASAGTDFAASFVQGSGPVPLGDPNALTVSDNTRRPLVSATVMITNALDGADESLSANTSGISISSAFDPASETLHLSGTASLEDYQRVLRSVSYEDVSSNPNTAPRTVTFSASDGSLTSTLATSTVSYGTPTTNPSLDLNGLAVGTGIDTVFTQGGGAIPIVDPNALIVTEGLNPFLSSATVTITNVQDGSAESLVADASGTAITASYDPSTGVLSLVGNASPADYERVLRSVKYNDAAPTAGSEREIDFVVQAGASSSPVVGASVIVLLAKKPPTFDANGPVSGTGFSAVFTAGEGAIPIVSPSLLTVGADGPTLASAKVRILNPLDGANEKLSVDVVGTPIAATYDPVSATLTLRGAADVADYQTVLRTLSYDNASAAPDPTPRMITAVVNDGQADSSAATLNVLPRGVSVQVGGGFHSSVSFHDSSGAHVSVRVLGEGTATLSFIGAESAGSGRRKRLTMTGQSVALDAITLDRTTAQSVLQISATGGIATVGRISGSLPVGALLAPRINLIGAGIAMTDAGYIHFVRLHGLVNFAGVTMPGLSPIVGLLLQFDQVGADCTIDLGSQLGLLRIGGRVVAKHHAPGVVFGPASGLTL